MGERIELKSNGGVTPAYPARPSSPRPGGVVIQEWWGLVPHIQRVADRLAAEGFVALAPDLYHGQQTKSPDEAGKLMMSLRVDQAARDLASAIDYVADQSASTKVGTVGFCMG